MEARQPKKGHGKLVYKSIINFLQVFNSQRALSNPCLLLGKKREMISLKPQGLKVVAMLNQQEEKQLLYHLSLRKSRHMLIKWVNRQRLSVTNSLNFLLFLLNFRRDTYKMHPSLHVGMKKKPLVPYHPESYRNRLPVVDLP